MREYVPILVLSVFAVALPALILFLSAILGPKDPNTKKLSVYECGMTTIGTTRVPVPVKYYMVALAFLVFDIEVLYMYPWATIFDTLGGFGFVEVMLFIMILLVGFIYLWGKGVFEWE